MRRFIIGIGIGVALSFSTIFVKAQLHDPSYWDAFIKDKDNGNKLIADTFLIQSFEGHTSDTWSYKTQGSPVVVDATEYGITGQRGQKCLRLSKGCGIELSIPKQSAYTTWFATFYLATRGVENAASITTKATCPKNNFEYKFTVTDAHRTLNFGDEFRNSTYIKDQVYIYTDPTNIKITTADLADDAWFFIDHLTGWGQIHGYSLFKGKGKWEENTKWTHYAPSGNRNALIKGEVEVQKALRCKDIHISDGILNITNNATFHSANLFLHENSAIYAKGELTISGKVTQYRTFPEKGKWYFISFPFDVYKKDIDPLFELKDEQFSGSGNYYYVLTYDSERRSLTNSLGNWKVIPASHPDDIPLFRQGKGYLIALDEKAQKSVLSFTSMQGVVWNSDQFSYTLDVPMKPSHTSHIHHGWVLMGNPFPSPLPVRQIQSNKQLDGNLYYFNGEEYEAVALDSDFVLPPFAAFFIKAENSTTLRFVPPSAVSAQKASYSSLSGTELKEPVFAEISGKPDKTVSFNYRIQGNTLYLDNIPSQIDIRISNLAGEIVLKKQMYAASAVIPLTFSKGVYVISMHTANEQAQEKFILY